MFAFFDKTRFIELNWRKPTKHAQYEAPEKALHSINKSRDAKELEANKNTLWCLWEAENFTTQDKIQDEVGEKADRTYFWGRVN